MLPPCRRRRPPIRSSFWEWKYSSVVGSETEQTVRMTASIFAYALNARVPEVIRIRRSEEVCAGWHPRSAKSIKTYEYRILNEEFPNPLERLYAHFTYLSLDEEKMRQAAASLVGEHDFKSFCSLHAQVETTVRTITELTVKRQGSRIVIRVSGTGFLYNMVRIIAGTLMEIGAGKYPPGRMREILEACDRSAAGPTAPARGLTLTEYRFLDFFSEKEIDTRGSVSYNNSV